jgi:peptide/nickel transport system permease protein
MLNYTIRRIALLIPTLFLVTIIAFLLIRLIPGNVIDIMISQMYGGTSDSSSGGNVGGGTSGVSVERARIEHLLGLDVPLYTQYARWMGFAPAPNPKTGKSEFNGILQGNLGVSIRTDRTLAEDLTKKMPVTFELSLLATLISHIISIPIGIYSAIRQDTRLDYVARSFSILAMATPGFWLATVLIVVGARYFHWSPAIEYIPFSVNPIENLKIMIIPALLMGLTGAGGTVRFLRTVTLEVMRQDYIRTAWSKGLRERVIVLRHALKNAMIPLANLIAGTIGGLIGGSVIMEQIFVLPGMGRFTYNMIIQRDYWVVLGATLIFGGFTMVMILLTDLSYAWFDPRIRYK